jgi:toxin CptA
LVKSDYLPPLSGGGYLQFYFPIMSIVVSAIVYPSRILFVAVTAACVGVTLVGLVIEVDYGGDIAMTQRLFAGAIVVFLAFFGFYHGTRHRKAIHIDISGGGSIHLSEVDSAASCVDSDRPHVRKNRQAVRLLRNSTIWPYFLLLRLQAESGQIIILPILHDGVSRDCFRTLSVACRWIAMHSDFQEF